MSKLEADSNERDILIIMQLDQYFQSEKDHAAKMINDIKATAVMSGPEGAITMNRDIFGSIIQNLQNKNKVHERIRLATGINSINTIVRIRRESKQAQATGSRMVTPKKKPRRKLITCDVFEITALNSIINSFYTVRGEIPSIKKIFAVAKEDLEYPGSVSTLRRILIKSLGYTSRKCPNNTIALVERPATIAWRSRYLRRIRQNDALGSSKKPVIYLSETWMNTHCMVKKCWLANTVPRDKKNDSTERGWIIVHAGGENGFVKGALLMFKCKLKTGNYHDEMNSTDFLRWINQCLIPNLPENAIIVMDNAPYHSMDVSETPNLSTVKSEMQSWLRDNNISYEEEFTKAELYELIKRHKPPKVDAIDNIFKTHGFEVLRLPPYNCDLNPMEYIWPLIKRRVADKNVSKKESDVERLILEAIVSITADDWKEVFSQVKETENVYHQREIIEDDDKFSVQRGGSSCDEDGDDFSNSDGEMSGIEAQSD